MLKYDDRFQQEVEIWRLVAGAIQCYSCKATASNEIEANVRCLETANLEDCSEFYQYYRFLINISSFHTRAVQHQHDLKLNHDSETATAATTITMHQHHHPGLEKPRFYTKSFLGF